MVDRV